MSQMIKFILDKSKIRLATSTRTLAHARKLIYLSRLQIIINLTAHLISFKIVLHISLLQRMYTMEDLCIHRLM